eukprot:Gb_34113 [translate_table: standard]
MAPQLRPRRKAEQTPSTALSRTRTASKSKGNANNPKDECQTNTPRICKTFPVKSTKPTSRRSNSETPKCEGIADGVEEVTDSSKSKPEKAEKTPPKSSRKSDISESIEEVTDDSKRKAKMAREFPLKTSRKSTESSKGRQRALDGTDLAETNSKEDRQKNTRSSGGQLSKPRKVQRRQNKSESQCTNVDCGKTSRRLFHAENESTQAEVPGGTEDVAKETARMASTEALPKVSEPSFGAPEADAISLDVSTVISSKTLSNQNDSMEVQTCARVLVEASPKGGHSLKNPEVNNRGDANKCSGENPDNHDGGRDGVFAEIVLEHVQTEEQLEIDSPAEKLPESNENMKIVAATVISREIGEIATSVNNETSEDSANKLVSPHREEAQIGKMTACILNKMVDVSLNKLACSADVEMKDANDRNKTCAHVLVEASPKGGHSLKNPEVNNRGDANKCSGENPDDHDGGGDGVVAEIVLENVHTEEQLETDFPAEKLPESNENMKIVAATAISREIGEIATSVNNETTEDSTNKLVPLHREEAQIGKMTACLLNKMVDVSGNKLACSADVEMKDDNDRNKTCARVLVEASPKGGHSLKNPEVNNRGDANKCSGENPDDHDGGGDGVFAEIVLEHVHTEEQLETDFPAEKLPESNENMKIVAATAINREISEIVTSVNNETSEDSANKLVPPHREEAQIGKMTACILNKMVDVSVNKLACSADVEMKDDNDSVSGNCKMNSNEAGEDSASKTEFTYCEDVLMNDQIATMRGNSSMVNNDIGEDSAIKKKCTYNEDVARTVQNDSLCGNNIMVNNEAWDGLANNTESACSKDVIMKDQNGAVCANSIMVSNETGQDLANKVEVGCNERSTVINTETGKDLANNVKVGGNKLSMMSVECYEQSNGSYSSQTKSTMHISPKKVLIEEKNQDCKLLNDNDSLVSSCKAMIDQVKVQLVTESINVFSDAIAGHGSKPIACLNAGDGSVGKVELTHTIKEQLDNDPVFEGSKRHGDIFRDQINAHKMEEEVTVININAMNGALAEIHEEDLILDSVIMADAMKQQQNKLIETGVGPLSETQEMMDEEQHQTRLIQTVVRDVKISHAEAVDEHDKEREREGKEGKVSENCSSTDEEEHSSYEGESRSLEEESESDKERVIEGSSSYGYEDDDSDEDDEEIAKQLAKSMKVHLPEVLSKKNTSSTKHARGLGFTFKIKGPEKLENSSLQLEESKSKRVSQDTSDQKLSWAPKVQLPTIEQGGELNKRLLGTTVWENEKQLQDGLLVPPRDPKKLNKLARKQVKDTSGAKWFDMPAQIITPELKKDLQLLKLRGVLDPKRHYKADDSKGLPKYFQVGTVIEPASEFYSARLTKKERKATIADELLSDPALGQYRKRKYLEIQDEKSAGRKKSWKQKRKV